MGKVRLRKLTLGCFTNGIRALDLDNLPKVFDLGRLFRVTLTRLIYPGNFTWVILARLLYPANFIKVISPR